MALYQTRLFAWLLIGAGLALGGCPLGQVTPQPPAISAITAGGNHTCVSILGGGTTTSAMKCWGSNSAGELGNGTNTDSNVPVGVTGLAVGTPAYPLLGIAAGDYHTCAIASRGKIFCWGDNSFGQLGLGNKTSFSIMQPVQRLTAATAIAAGEKHTCAIQGGTVGCWGHYALTTTDLVPTMVQGVSANVIAAGSSRTCVNEPATPTRMVNVKCWSVSISSNIPGSVPIPASTIAVGRAHVCAIEPWGAIKCWGSNAYGQLGNGTRTSSSTPVDISHPGNIPAIALAAGDDHACAVFQGGSVECWGLNDSGQTGDGATLGGNTLRPVAVAGITNAISVAAGDAHSCASFDDRGVHRVACWGYNKHGQLGNGTNNSSVTPVRVSGLP